MDDHNAAGGNDSGTEGSIATNCPHTVTERIGRVRNGTAVIDLDCVDCSVTVEGDVRERTVERGDGVATDGGEDFDLTPGEDAAWCPDCEDWLPCDCDGIPVAMEIRPYEPEEDQEVATDGGQLKPKHRGTWTADSRGEVKLGSSVARQLGADRGDEVLVTWDDEVRVHGDAEAYEGPQSLSTTVAVGHEERIALPAWARRELDLEPGDEIRAVADGDDVVVEEVGRDD